MKRIPLLVWLLILTLVGSALAVKLIDDTNDQTVGGKKTFLAAIAGSLTLAQLSATATNGTINYCSDCVLGSNPCSGGGSGAFAVRAGGAWVCASVGSGSGLPPFADNTALVKDSADPTKQLILDAGTIGTGTTRTATFPDRNGTVAMTAGALTSGNLAKYDASGNLVDDGIAIASLSGNTTKAATVSGSLTNGNFVKADINGNLIDGGSGAGSVASGTTAITGGTDKALLFNDASVVNGNDANITWDKTLQALNVGGSNSGVTNSITVENTNAAAASDAKVVVASDRAAGLAANVYTANAGGNAYSIGIDGGTSGLPLTIGASATPFGSPIFRMTSGGAQRAATGSAGTPSRSWLSDTNTGWFSLGSGGEAWSGSGVQKFTLDGTGAKFSASRSGNSVLNRAENTSNTAGSDAVFEMINGGSLGGDMYSRYKFGGLSSNNFATGIRNSGTIAYKVCRNSSGDLASGCDLSVNANDIVNVDSGKFGITATTFASLGSADNGEQRFCSDCLPVNPCASGGNGAMAFRINGSWNCSPAGNSLFINVKDYGATGDGITDDTSPISNALASAAEGSTVFFPRGTYKLATLTVTKAVHLLGEGWQNDPAIVGTILQSTATSGTAITILTTGTSAHKSSISHLAIVGPNSGTATGIAMGSATTFVTSAYWADVFVGRFGTQVVLTNVQDSSFYSLRVQEGATGLKLLGSTNQNVFVGLYTGITTAQAIQIGTSSAGTDASMNSFLGGLVQNNTGGGVLIQNGSYNAFEHFWFENGSATLPAFKIDATTGSTVVAGTVLFRSNFNTSADTVVIDTPNNGSGRVWAVENRFTGNVSLVTFAPRCFFSRNTYGGTFTDSGGGSGLMRLSDESVTSFKEDLLFGADNTNDIGASGATRPRTGYFGTSVVSPGATLSSIGSVGGVPTGQTIAAGNTVTADGCGGVKRVSSAGAVTTDTTNTFTAPAAANAGCVMRVCNTAANAITLDANANFKTSGGVDVVLTDADDCVPVGSDGVVWRQMGAVMSNS
jgi:hypothetical protein